MTDVCPERYNIPLLRKSVEFLRGNPEMHLQSEWLEQRGCGTVGCLAGTIALLDGAKPHIQWRGQQQFTDVVKDGVVTSVREYAQQAVGFTETEAFLVFDTASAETMWERLDYIVGRWL